MIILTIKVKTDTSTFTKKAFLPDTYNVCKDNTNLQNRVEKAIEEVGFKDAIDAVTVTAKFEW